jgi:hypothetical protein
MYVSATAAGFCVAIAKIGLLLWPRNFVYLSATIDRITPGIDPIWGKVLPNSIIYVQSPNADPY